MYSEPHHDLTRSRWSRRTGRIIDVLCFVALVAVMLTVIIGFTLRAIWAHGYFIAVALAIVGALVVLIGLAQQAIAARDAETWRDMALWQIRAARQKTANDIADDGTESAVTVDPESQQYYEHLVEVLIDSVRRADETALK